MIPPQPHFRKIGKAAVFRYFLRDKMAVIIKDGHPRRRFVVEPLSGFGGKQKILVHELFHTDPPINSLVLRPEIW
jgi:hypothetical protein